MNVCIRLQTFVSFTYRYLESPIWTNEILFYTKKSTTLTQISSLSVCAWRLKTMMRYFSFSDSYFITLSLTYEMERIFILRDRILRWKLSHTDELKWMPKKSIDLHVDSFLLRYLDTVDVEGINMLAF